MNFCQGLFADYNCLTTAEGLLSAGKQNEKVTFDMFFPVASKSICFVTFDC